MTCQISVKIVSHFINLILKSCERKKSLEIRYSALISLETGSPFNVTL